MNINSTILGMYPIPHFGNIIFYFHSGLVLQQESELPVFIERINCVTGGIQHNASLPTLQMPWAVNHQWPFFNAEMFLG